MSYLNKIPEGWKPIDGAIVYPKGTRWISNNQSRFSPDYKTALVREELVHEWHKTHGRSGDSESVK